MGSGSSRVIRDTGGDGRADSVAHDGEAESAVKSFGERDLTCERQDIECCDIFR